VANWQFTLGTRRLTWLEPAPPHGADDKPGVPPAKPEPPRGVEALEFRELNSTNYVKGILTLVPLPHVRAIEYDHDKQTVTVAIAGGKAGADVTLTGTTKYSGINKLTVVTTIDLGAKGEAEIKFLGGVPRGVRAFRFPGAIPPPPPAGRPASVTAADKGEHAVTDLQPLYRLGDGTSRAERTLVFRKTLKADVTKLRSLHFTGAATKEGVEATVTWDTGEEQTLTLLPTVTLDGQPAALEGLVARVPAGYKLFPVHTITEVRFGDKKPEPEEGAPTAYNEERRGTVRS
jgi:hypothetical protein